MESKKTLSSLMMDDLQPPQPGPSSTSIRPPSPFRISRLARRRPPSPRPDSLTHLIEPSQPMSCVTRETFEEDCARHRFIVWAAVKRNSCSRMTAEERLECPLLRCTQRFLDHETMLRHLAACELLSSGEYWCYDHMRVERFDDVKCRRCLGHPSKRRKMLSMAKTFFHSLGQKSKKATPGFDLEPRDPVLPPPPSYDSIHVSPQPAHPTELSATEIVEIDSTEIPATATTTTLGPSYDGVIDPQALLVPELDSELDSIAPSPGSSIQWQMMNGVVESGWPVTMPITPPEESELRSPAGRPSLQVNTHGLRGGSRPAPRLLPTVPRSKFLSPSSSVRSNASTNSNVSTMSNVSSIASCWSGAWSMASGFDTSLASPDDIVSQEPFLSDNLFAGPCDAPDATFPKLPRGFYSELPADVPSSRVPELLSPDPMLFSFNEDPPSYATDIELTGDSLDLLDLDDAEVEESNICCSKSKSLVASAWDALQEHIVSSKLKIRETRGNPLADQLPSKSTNSIATTGLRTLRSLLDDNHSIPAIDLICFIHLIYAFSLAIHEQDAAARAKDLFLQSLSYATCVPLGERELYTQLIFDIWQPTDITQEHISSHFSRRQSAGLGRSSSFKGKEPEVATCHPGTVGADALLTVACNFLDELESSTTLGEAPSSVVVQTSSLYAEHLLNCNPHAGVNLPFSVTVNIVLTKLLQDFCDVEGLVPKLSGLLERVSNGVVSSVRRTELELLNAGKGCMSSSRFFDVFVPQVRNLCDQIYRQHDSGTSRRTDYYHLGISLIESILPGFDPSKGDTRLLNEAIDMDEFVDFETTTTAPQARVPCDGPPSAASGPSPQPETEQAAQQQQAQPQKVQADSCCDICGYRPKGDPQWFKGSMAKHRKLQHSAEPPRLYKCPYANCTSQYKNRPDNLRQHQIEKGHFVGEEPVATSRRPSKRKKTEQDDE